MPAPDRPRVSVITPFFNAEHYLAEAVESALEQEYQEFELLLVDDGSTDESTAIARQFEAAEPGRIRYLEHDGHENRGATVSRNLALQHAKGEFIAFLDADDRWRPAKLREQLELLDRIPALDAICGAVNFWGRHNGGTDSIITTGHVLDRPVTAPAALLNVYPLGKADPPCPSDLLMRRSIVDRVGGFENSFVGPLQLYEDQAFLAKFFLEGTILFSSRVWLDYRLHDQSCTATVGREGMAPEVRRHCLEWFEGYLRGTRHWRNPRIRWALWKALRPYRHPHVSRAGRALKRLFRLRPQAKPSSPFCA